MSQGDDNLRLQIVKLSINTSKTTREIAADVGVSQSTVVATIRRYKEEGLYYTKYENCGRKPVFDDRNQRHIRNLCINSPRSTTGAIQMMLGASDDCSLRSMQRTLASAGCKVVNKTSIKRESCRETSYVGSRTSDLDS